MLNKYAIAILAILVLLFLPGLLRGWLKGAGETIRHLRRIGKDNDAR